MYVRASLPLALLVLALAGATPPASARTRTTVAPPPVVSTAPTEWRAADGVTRPIETTIRTSEDGAFSNATNTLVTGFPGDASGAVAVTRRADGGVVRWRPAGLRLRQVDGSETTLASPEAALALLDEGGAQIVYADVYPGVNERYTVLPGKLEHDIVLTGPPPLAKVFAGDALVIAWRLETEGLGRVEQRDGAIVFLDRRQAPALTMPAPFVVDAPLLEASPAAPPGVPECSPPQELATPAPTIEPALHLEQIADGLEVVLTLPATDLLDPATVYPLVIDPTIVDVASGDQDVTVYGIDAFDYDYWDRNREGVATGDLNGDGANDLVVSVTQGDGPGNSRAEAGEVHVLFGPFSSGDSRDLATVPADVTIHGAGAGHYLASIATGDLSGDGADDLVVAAWNTGLRQDGMLYVLFGPLTAGSVIDLATDPVDVTVIGDYAQVLGMWVGVDDLSGDAQPDLVLGLPDNWGKWYCNWPGSVSALFGPFASGTTMYLASTSFDVEIIGIDILYDWFGGDVAIGDVDGDGANDVVASARGSWGPSNTRWAAGEVHVVLGPFASGHVQSLAVDPADATFYGADRYDYLGWHGLAVGDVSGDGIDDVIMGASRADGAGNARPQSGEAYVAFGPLSGGVFDLASWTPSVTILGANLDDLLGHAVAAADLTGDGFAEVVLGASYAATPNGRTGAAYVAFSPLTAGTTIDLGAGDADVELHLNHAGFSIWALPVLVGAGDLSGDGTADLIVASPGDGADHTRTKAGEWHVVFGESIGGCASQAFCDDAVFCNGPEVCSPGVGCLPGTPPDCDDGSACTSDSCDESADRCQNLCDDTVLPVLSLLPPDRTDECDAVSPPPTVDASDNCDPAPVLAYAEARRPGSCADAYFLDRTWTATDECGNAASHTQVVAVVDTTAPALSGVPADVTVECDAVPAPPTVTASDNCDAAPPVTYAEVRIDGSCPQSYTLRRTWAATDACGNATSATQTINVIDTAAPALSGVPADVTVECDAVPTAPTVSATDSCDGAPVVTYNEVRVDGSCPDTYTLQRTWTATDACGNATSSTQTINVVDTTAPALLGVPADATVECDAVPTAPTVTATDNCDGTPAVSYAEVRIDGTCPDTYTLRRTWTATDACGNATTSTQTLNVVDTTAPALAGVPTDATVECDAVPTAPTVTATDNCDAAPVVAYAEVRIDGSCPDTYTLQRTWTATDACGNTTSSTQTLNVVDTAGPALAGVPADATVECDAVPTAPTVTATDNCDGAPVVSYAEVRVDGSCPDTYTLRRTWTATDVCGNTTSSTQTLNVVDTTSPALLGVPADATVECDAVPVPPTVTATDNCDGAPLVAYAEVRVDGPCPDSYTLLRTWTATDACGNATVATQTLSVVDTTSPALLGVPADATVECDAVPVPPAVTATDNCDGAPLVAYAEVKVDGTCADSYQLLRTWTATDACGNLTSATQTIAVVDTTPPDGGAVLAPVAPLPPRPPDVPASVCSSTAVRALRVVCQLPSDDCDPSPSLRTTLVVTHHDVSEPGVCAARQDEIEVACDEVIELRLLAPLCPKKAQSPRSSLSLNSAGVKVVTGETVTLRSIAADRCGNVTLQTFDPAADGSPTCDDVLDDGTCCPAVAAPPPDKCKLGPCGAAPPALAAAGGPPRAPVGHAPGA